MHNRSFIRKPQEHYILIWSLSQGGETWNSYHFSISRFFFFLLPVHLEICNCIDYLTVITSQQCHLVMVWSSMIGWMMKGLCRTLRGGGGGENQHTSWNLACIFIECAIKSALCEHCSSYKTYLGMEAMLELFREIPIIHCRKYCIVIGGSVICVKS